MGFSNYLLTVVGAVLTAVVADIINSSVSKKAKGVEKYIKFGIILCVLSVLVLPLVRLFGDAPELIPKTQITDAGNTGIIENDSLYILEKECENALEEELIAKTGIKPVSVSIEMKWGNDCPVIEKALIIIPKGSDENKSMVAEEAEKALGLKAEIITEETYEGNNTEKH